MLVVAKQFLDLEVEDGFAVAGEKVRAESGFKNPVNLGSDNFQELPNYD